MILIVVSRYNENIEWTKEFPNVLIYNKGEKLEDYIIFLQGNPFDHSPNIIQNLKNYINDDKLNINFEFLSEKIITSNLSGCPHHKKLPLIDIYEQLFNERINDMEFKFGAGAQFIVSKNQILKRPKEFYLKIIKLLEYSKNPIEGYVIERFHQFIFN